MYMSDTEIADKLGDITRAIEERIKGELGSDNVIDLAVGLLGDYVTESIFEVHSEFGYDEVLNDVERDMLVVEALGEALGELADKLRRDDESAHERADSDSRVIYTAETLDFCNENMAECDEAYANAFGADMGDSFISSDINTAVYLVLRNEYEQELAELADAIDDYNPGDFI